jgi:hypothetical protein
MTNRSIADGAIAAFAAILESMPENQRASATNFARTFLDAGVIGGEDSRRFVEGLFLLTGKKRARR